MEKLNYKALQVTIALLVCLLVAGSNTSDRPALAALPEASGAGQGQAQLQVKQQPPGQPGQPGQPEAPVGSGFTYQGSLKNGGSPANGQYDFQFTLYDALTGGNVVGSIVTSSNVTVTVGLFTVLLDFGQPAFTGEARYMEIAVRQSGGGGYTLLAPRQALTPAPYALSLKPGAVISGTTGGGVGILTAINNGPGVGVYGVSIGSSGVYGTSPSGFGVLGNSTSGYGVYGTSNSLSGVWGDSNSGYGVKGVSTSNSGVDGFSYTGKGVLGYSGSNAGVHGETPSDYPGVEGNNTGGSGIGPGVRGDSVNGPGVFGYSTNNQGVQGVTTDGYGVHGEGTAYGYGVYGRSTDGVGVYGISTNSSGVVGVSSSTSAFGVTGESPAYGVFGTSSSASGKGVVGFSVNSSGVYGSSTENEGLRGQTGSAYPGVEGYNFGAGGGAGPGVRGDGNGGPGVYGISANSWAGWFEGNVNVTGSCCLAAEGTYRIDHPQDPANKYLNQSAVESPDMKTIYDGIATLDPSGEAWVDMPAYSQSLNQDFRYQLTPIGAPGRDLYIAQEIQNNRFKIAGGKAGMKVSWQVTGTRHDPYAVQNPVTVEQDKPADEKGKYLHPEVYGQPENMGIGYEQAQKAKQQPLPSATPGR